MLVELLCKRILYVCHDILTVGAKTFNWLPELVNAYKNSKALKCSSYHNVCWEGLPKNFDKDNIRNILKELY